MLVVREDHTMLVIVVIECTRTEVDVRGANDEVNAGVEMVPEVLGTMLWSAVEDILVSPGVDESRISVVCDTDVMPFVKAVELVDWLDVACDVLDDVSVKPSLAVPLEDSVKAGVPSLCVAEEDSVELMPELEVLSLPVLANLEDVRDRPDNILLDSVSKVEP